MFSFFNFRYSARKASESQLVETTFKNLRDLRVLDAHDAGLLLFTRRDVLVSTSTNNDDAYERAMYKFAALRVLFWIDFWDDLWFVLFHSIETAG